MLFYLLIINLASTSSYSILTCLIWVRWVSSPTRSINDTQIWSWIQEIWKLFLFYTHISKFSTFFLWVCLMEKLDCLSLFKSFKILRYVLTVVLVCVSTAMMPWSSWALTVIISYLASNKYDLWGLKHTHSMFQTNIKKMEYLFFGSSRELG